MMMIPCLYVDKLQLLSLFLVYLPLCFRYVFDMNLILLSSFFAEKGFASRRA